MTTYIDTSAPSITYKNESDFDSVLEKALNGSYEATWKICSILEESTKLYRTTFKKSEESLKLNETNEHAQYFLGLIYKKFYNNKSMSDDYIKKSAENGSMFGQCAFGENLRLAGNYSEAIDWWKAAAFQGHVVAQYNLAVSHYFGFGTEKNYDEAYKLFLFTANNNYKDANYYLGKMYESGHGCSTDLQKALSYYELSKNENPYSKFALAHMLFFGRVNKKFVDDNVVDDNIKQDITLAIKYFEEAAVSGNSDASLFLGIVYEKGENIEKNIDKALIWYQLASNQGSASGIKNYARLRGSKNSQLIGKK